MLPGASSVIMAGDAATGGGTLDTQTVTVGSIGTFPDRIRGWSTIYSMGGIADGTSNIYAGAPITELYWEEGGAGGTPILVLKITGATNTGWTSMVIGTNSYTRASASFSGGQWTWTGGANPFGGSGNKIVGFN